MRLLLFTLALLVGASLPAGDPPLGDKLGSVAVPGGVFELYEKGSILIFPDGSEIVAKSTPKPIVLRVTWQHETGSGEITIEVEYEIPVIHPSDAQMRIYAERFRRMVAVQRGIFPPVVR